MCVQTTRPSPPEQTPNLDSTAAQSSPASLLLNRTPSAKVASFQVFHPSPDHIRLLWSKYIDNIHPIISLYPGWRLNELSECVISGLATLPVSLHAISFATYALAVLSLSDAECYQNFNAGRACLLNGWQALTEQALSLAQVFQTSDINVLHAFLLYMHILCHRCDIYQVWALMGTLVRVAQRHDLHRDPVAQNYDAWNSEYRRRLWFNIQKLNSRTGELCGRDGAAVDFPWDTQMPFGFNDHEFQPDMHFPSSRADVIPDDTMVAMVRFELLSFEKSLTMANGSKPGLGWLKMIDVSLHEKELAVDTLERHLQSAYLRHCDPLKPQHFFASVVVRGAISVMRLVAFKTHSKACGSYDLKSHAGNLAQLARKCLEYHILSSNSAMLARFKWHACWQFQWVARESMSVYIGSAIADQSSVFILLQDIKERGSGAEVESSWKVISEMFESHSEITFHIGKAAHAAAGEMLLQAWNASHTAGFDEPSYVQKVRCEIRRFAETSQDHTMVRRCTRTSNLPTSGSGQLENNGLVNTPSVNTESIPPAEAADMIWPEDDSLTWNIWDNLPWDQFNLLDLDFLSSEVSNGYTDGEKYSYPSQTQSR